MQRYLLSRLTLVATALLGLGVVSPAQAQSVNFTSDQVLAGIRANMTLANQINAQPHLNTQTQRANVNVYEVSSGVFAYTSSLAVDTDGIDRDPDPDHQNQAAFNDDNGTSLGAHRVPYYVLGSICPDGSSPCDFFFYRDHNISGLQFALIFFQGRVVGAVFGDTQGPPGGDPRELGEASTRTAQLLGVNSSGIDGGVDNGVTVAIFSGPQWVVHGTDDTLSDNAQQMVQNALNTLGLSLQAQQGGAHGASQGAPQGNPQVAPQITDQGNPQRADQGATQGGDVRDPRSTDPRPADPRTSKNLF
jgi:hypothetical protein